MDSRIEQSGREFIENDLNFSFSTMADKRIANLLLKSYLNGAKAQCDIFKQTLEDKATVEKETSKLDLFKIELKALLEKYNASIFCDIEGDTHGLINTMKVEIDNKDYELAYGTYLDEHELK